MTVENGSNSSQLRGDINVTPMIDVLLVLLIIFMVIAPVLPHGMNAALPKRSANPNLAPEAPIIVRITNTRNGLLTYKINQDDVTLDQLGGRLTSILSLRANKVLFIKGDDNLDFSFIATVMDIGKGAGADHIGLLTSKDPL
jgi:biopolymer transport protein TolR